MYLIIQMSWRLNQYDLFRFNVRNHYNTGSEKEEGAWGLNQWSDKFVMHNL